MPFLAIPFSFSVLHSLQEDVNTWNSGSTKESTGLIMPHTGHRMIMFRNAERAEFIAAKSSYTTLTTDSDRSLKAQ